VARQRPHAASPSSDGTLPAVASTRGCWSRARGGAAWRRRAESGPGAAVGGVRGRRGRRRGRQEGSWRRQPEPAARAHPGGGGLSPQPAQVGLNPPSEPRAAPDPDPTGGRRVWEAGAAAAAQEEAAGDPEAEQELEDGRGQVGARDSNAGRGRGAGDARAMGSPLQRVEADDLGPLDGVWMIQSH
jgi:hypothetical protein